MVSENRPISVRIIGIYNMNANIHPLDTSFKVNSSERYVCFKNDPSRDSNFHQTTRETHSHSNRCMPFRDNFLEILYNPRSRVHGFLQKNDVRVKRVEETLEGLYFGVAPKPRMFNDRIKVMETLARATMI